MFGGGSLRGLLRDALKDATRRPDVGGPELHPTAGASAVGARKFLIAYNIYLAADGEEADVAHGAGDCEGHSGVERRAVRGEGDGCAGQRAGAGEHEYH